jgi:DNA processing protein
MLIRDGATLIRNAEDVIEALPQAPIPKSAPQPDLPRAPSSASSLRDIASLHTQILNRLGPSPLAEDQLIRDLATPAHRIAPALLDLELDGRITRHPGGLLALAL